MPTKPQEPCCRRPRASCAKFLLQNTSGGDSLFHFNTSIRKISILTVYLELCSFKVCHMHNHIMCTMDLKI